MYRSNAEPPMDLGEVLKGTDADGNLINTDKLGQIFYFDAKTLRHDAGRKSGKPIGAVLLRNTAGFALLGKRLGQIDRTAGYGMLHNVDGYSTTLANRRIVVIDPWLNSAGVADDQIFWGVFSGPALILTPVAGADFNGDIAAAAPLVASTGTTTGATTSGRVSNVTLAGQTAATVAFNMANNLVGYAMSARTTGETNADCLVDLAIKLLT